MEIANWPQILVATLIVFVVIGSFVRHGKPIDPKPINCMAATWFAFWFAAVLGFGGFWRPLGW